MTERGLSREAAQLRERLGPRLCAEGAAPCQTVTTAEVRIMPSGAEERTGAEMRPLCGPCPNRESRAVLHVEVRLDYRNRHGYEQPPSAARMPPVGREAGPEGHRAPATTGTPTAPDDGLVLPAAFGPDHPARLIAEGREPEPPRRAKPPGRRSDETPRISPEDFGL